MDTNKMLVIEAALTNWTPESAAQIVADFHTKREATQPTRANDPAITTLAWTTVPPDQVEADFHAGVAAFRRMDAKLETAVQAIWGEHIIRQRHQFEFDTADAWIVEHRGTISLCHYKACADKARENGALVTPYFSKVPK